ncbi:MAG: hypothetical protein Q9168_003335 [Polycauliona sp. 1 TL-2023]
MSGVFEPEGGPRPLVCAAMRGQANDLQLFMDSGLYPRIHGQPGDRIINYSIVGSNVATFDFLATLTPNEWINEVDYLGRGPLHRALEYPGFHTKEIVKRLLDAGADVHLKDANELQPTDTEIQGTLGILKLILTLLYQADMMLILMKMTSCGGLQKITHNEIGLADRQPYSLKLNTPDDGLMTIWRSLMN